MAPAAMHFDASNEAHDEAARLTALLPACLDFWKAAHCL
jgi:hypothetical protein